LEAENISNISFFIRFHIFLSLVVPKECRFRFLNAGFSENRSKQGKFIWGNFLNLSEGGMGGTAQERIATCDDGLAAPKGSLQRETANVGRSQ
jgi:hypothetical protein